MASVELRLDTRAKSPCTPIELSAHPASDIKTGLLPFNTRDIFFVASETIASLILNRQPNDHAMQIVAVLVYRYIQLEHTDCARFATKPSTLHQASEIYSSFTYLIVACALIGFKLLDDHCVGVSEIAKVCNVSAWYLTRVEASIFLRLVQHSSIHVELKDLKLADALLKEPPTEYGIYLRDVVCGSTSIPRTVEDTEHHDGIESPPSPEPPVDDADPSALDRHELKPQSSFYSCVVSACLSLIQFLACTPIENASNPKIDVVKVLCRTSVGQ
jgi:hypothetical protein